MTHDTTIKWFIELLVLSTSVFVVTHILPSVHVKNFHILPSVYVKNFGTAVVVALVYGILKMLFRGVLIFLSLPLMIVTLGLFYFVINAFLLWITDKLIDGFEIKGFFTTIIAAFLISLIDTVLHWVIPGI